MCFCQLKFCQIGNKRIDWLLICCLCLLLAWQIIYSTLFLFLDFTRNLRFHERIFSSNLWCSLLIVCECWARHVTCKRFLKFSFSSSMNNFGTTGNTEQWAQHDSFVESFSFFSQQCENSGKKKRKNASRFVLYFLPSLKWSKRGEAQSGEKYLAFKAAALSKAASMINSELLRS